jgi:hypothetical protein
MDLKKMKYGEAKIALANLGGKITKKKSLPNQGKIQEVDENQPEHAQQQYHIDLNNKGDKKSFVLD